MENASLQFAALFPRRIGSAGLEPVQGAIYEALKRLAYRAGRCNGQSGKIEIDIFNHKSAGARDEQHG